MTIILKKSWIDNFNKLLNEDIIGGLGTREDTLSTGHMFYHRIKVIKLYK